MSACLFHDVPDLIRKRNAFNHQANEPSLGAKESGADMFELIHVVERLASFVGRLASFVGKFIFFVDGLTFLVNGLIFFVGGLTSFVDGLTFFVDGLIKVVPDHRKSADEAKNRMELDENEVFRGISQNQGAFPSSMAKEQSKPQVYSA